MEISKKQYEENFAGFTVVSCAVRSKDIFYFSLCEEAPESTVSDQDKGTWPARRMVDYVKTMPPDERWDHEEFSGMENFKFSISQKPKQQLICVDVDGEVFVHGSGQSGLEKPVADFFNGGALRGGVSKSKAIDGYAYIAGGGRSVAFRKAKSKWVSLSQGIPFTYDDDAMLAGFRDIDGFSADDIYCVGGKGDVWHFNGARWRKIPFTSQINLYTVCCGGDGNVYISGYQGITFQGRDDMWKKIYDGEFTIPFRDMLWHDDRIWCTSDYGLWNICDGNLAQANVGADVLICSGHLSTCGDVLLVAGQNGAAYLQSGAWHRIF